MGETRAVTAREGQTFNGMSRAVRYANFVKLPHTLFALPFALVGVVLASYHSPVTVREVLWIALAFTAARFAAMGFNRIVDREIDARNPRTRMRELPSGTMGVTEATVAVTVACAIFLLADYELNWLCLALAPLALAWVFFYSYTKRFTRWSHMVLGLGLSIAPVGGYLAITGRWGEPWWMLCCLALAVATWVAGFDILYALQDVDFDRENALHSLPVRLGESKALLVARLMHIGTVASLVAVGFAAHAGAIYAIGVLVAGTLLLYEHTLVRAGDLSKLNAAFFTMNGIISIVYFGFVFAERVVERIAR